MTKEEEKKEGGLLSGIFSIVMGILVIGGVIYWQSYSSKNDLMEYAEEELKLKKYSVVEMEILESEMAFKGRKATGKLAFIVKDEAGSTFKGKADIDNETEWIFFNKNVFTITEIKPIK
jgi:hypothetical protein